MKASGRRGPGAYAFMFAVAAVALAVESIDVWKEYRFFAVLGIAAAIVCTVLAFYNLLGSATHTDTTLDIQGPVWPGGTLVATLRAPGLRGARLLGATLICKEVVERSAWSDERFEERIVWSKEAKFPLAARSDGTDCRIEFEVPVHLRPSSVEVSSLDEPENAGMLWELLVHARGVGLELKRRFIVPVGGRPAGNPASKIAG